MQAHRNAGFTADSSLVTAHLSLPWRFGGGGGQGRLQGRTVPFVVEWRLPYSASTRGSKLVCGNPPWYGIDCPERKIITHSCTVEAMCNSLLVPVAVAACLFIKLTIKAAGRLRLKTTKCRRCSALLPASLQNKSKISMLPVNWQCFDESVQREGSGIYVQEPVNTSFSMCVSISVYFFFLILQHEYKLSTQLECENTSVCTQRMKHVTHPSGK